MFYNYGINNSYSWSNKNNIVIHNNQIKATTKVNSKPYLLDFYNEKKFNVQFGMTKIFKEENNTFLNFKINATDIFFKHILIKVNNKILVDEYTDKTQIEVDLNKTAIDFKKLQSIELLIYKDQNPNNEPIVSYLVKLSKFETVKFSLFNSFRINTITVPHTTHIHFTHKSKAVIYHFFTRYVFTWNLLNKKLNVDDILQVRIYNLKKYTKITPNEVEVIDYPGLMVKYFEFPPLIKTQILPLKPLNTDLLAASEDNLKNKTINIKLDVYSSIANDKKSLDINQTIKSQRGLIIPSLFQGDLVQKVTLENVLFKGTIAYTYSFNQNKPKIKSNLHYIQINEIQLKPPKYRFKLDLTKLLELLSIDTWNWNMFVNYKKDEEKEI
ncbi:hypothetical protein GE118_02800 [Mycoplasma sp. NEAQ87857]|uniref:hypothetical protein n=1 Tax=Mycoplasma sp. NEAQ87857 TaxID=2683967 RepID=UPI0013175829|nr:hypothetical protein [Mycoplasma sp. NEAQ87857]QGZ97722.1 hypothetical protein GE118_02800 [Mycoplasma sp. NEAQ87857]